MPLTDAKIRNVKPGKKPIRCFDGGGLYLEISPAGGRHWRWKYRFGKKEKRLSLGAYPTIGLKKAREKREEAKRLLNDGVDPGEYRKAMKSRNADLQANTFEAIAREWFVKFSPPWASSHAEKTIRRLEVDIFPYLGRRPIAEIKAPELLAVIRRIEDRGAIETAHRALQNCGQVFRYAVASARAERDPSGDLRGALTPVVQTHFASITEPKKIGELLRTIDSFQGYFVTRQALRLAPLVFVRPGELRHAEWSEVDLEKAEWNIPAQKMKTREPHLVPLSKQALGILQELQALTGSGRYVFPCARSSQRPMSNGALLAALRRLGYSKEEMTPHGFRAMARTLLEEELKFRPEIIEQQLAHGVKDPLGRAYNRTKHLEERRQMMHGMPSGSNA